MGGHVDHRYVGLRWERVQSLVLICWTASSHGLEQAKELCICTTSTLRVRGWGSCFLEGDA